MGLTSSGRYISARRNAEATSEKFNYDKEAGYFGIQARKNKPQNREIVSNNPIGDAKELFAQLSNGGEIYEAPNLKGEAIRLPDGSIIILRIETSSVGSPAVSISVRENSYNTKVKNQKIHFKKGE